MCSLLPLVRILKQYKIPHFLAVFIAMTGVVLLCTFFILPLIPFFTEQTQIFIQNLPSIINKTTDIFGIHISSSQSNSLLNSELGNISKNAFEITKKVFSGFFSLLTIFVLSVYLLLDYSNIKRHIITSFPKKSQEKITTVLSQVEHKLGSWLTGQLVLSIVIGFVTWVALSLLNVPYALPLAVIAGMLEIVPTLGPIIASVPAIIVSLNTSVQLAGIVALVYIGVQALENNILVPRIMKAAVGLNPILILIGIIIGSKLLGIAGALLSVPFISLISIIITNIREETKES